MVPNSAPMTRRDFAARGTLPLNAAASIAAAAARRPSYRGQTARPPPRAPGLPETQSASTDSIATTSPVTVTVTMLRQSSELHDSDQDQFRTAYPTVSSRTSNSTGSSSSGARPTVFDSPSNRRRGIGSATSSASRPSRAPTLNLSTTRSPPQGTLPPLAASVLSGLIPASANSSYHELDEHPHRQYSAASPTTRSTRASSALQSDTWHSARSALSVSGSGSGGSSRFRNILANTSQALSSSFQKLAELAEGVAQGRDKDADPEARTPLVDEDGSARVSGSDQSIKVDTDADVERYQRECSLDHGGGDNLGGSRPAPPAASPAPSAAGPRSPIMMDLVDPEQQPDGESSGPSSAHSTPPSARHEDDEFNPLAHTVLGSAARVFVSKSTRLVSFRTLRFSSKAIETKFHEHYVRTMSAPIMVLTIGLLPLIFSRAGLSVYTSIKYQQVLADCPTTVLGECALCQTVVSIMYLCIGIVTFLLVFVSLTLRVEAPGSRRVLFVMIAVLCFLVELLAVTCPGYCHARDGSPLFRNHNDFTEECPGSAAAGSIDALLHFWATEISVSCYALVAASTLPFRTALIAAILVVVSVTVFGSHIDSSAGSWIWLIIFNLADDAVKSLVGLYQRELLVRATFYHNVRQAAATHAQLRAAATHAVLPYTNTHGNGHTHAHSGAGPAGSGGPRSPPTSPTGIKSPTSIGQISVTSASSGPGKPKRLDSGSPSGLVSPRSSKPTVMVNMPLNYHQQEPSAWTMAPEMASTAVGAIQAARRVSTATETSSNTAIMTFGARSEMAVGGARRLSYAAAAGPRRESVMSAATTVTAGSLLPGFAKIHISSLPSEYEALSTGSAFRPVPLGVGSGGSSGSPLGSKLGGSGGAIHVSQLDFSNLLTLPRAMHASLMSIRQSAAHSVDPDGVGHDQDGDYEDRSKTNRMSSPELMEPAAPVVPLGAAAATMRQSVPTLVSSPAAPESAARRTANRSLPTTPLGTMGGSPWSAPLYLNAPQVVVVATTLDQAHAGRDALDDQSDSDEFHDGRDLDIPHGALSLQSTVASNRSTVSSNGSTTSSTSSMDSSSTASDPSNHGDNNSSGALGTSVPALKHQLRAVSDSAVLPHQHPSPHRPLHDAWGRHPRERDRPSRAFSNVRDSVVITSSMLPALEPMGLDAALHRTEENYTNSVSTSSILAPRGSVASGADAAARRRQRRMSRSTTASASKRSSGSSWYRRLRRVVHRLRGEFFYKFPDRDEEQRYLAYSYVKLKMRMQITAVTGFMMQLLVAVMMKLSQAGRQAVNDAVDNTDDPVGNGMFGDWLARVKPFVLEWWFPYALHLAFYTIQLVVARSRSALFVGASLERYAVAHAVIFIACVVALDAQIRMLTHNFVLIQSACHQVLAAVFGITTLRLRPRAHGVVLVAFVLVAQIEFALLLVNGAAIETLAKTVIVTSTTLVSLVLSVYFESANRRYFQVKSHVEQSASRSRANLPHLPPPLR
ncbi:hypothetical protein H9P43_005802 [Blastocladiella emersonii ATCC 22665]|nr:hypothetical protein H9P43_005802 [Blastocladiella emersonii ATCC 22665]